MNLGATMRPQWHRHRARASARRRQQALARLSLDALSGDGWRQLPSDAAAAAAAGLDSQQALVMELQQDGSTLSAIAGYGWSEPIEGEAVAVSDDGPSRRSLRDGRPVIVRHGRGNEPAALLRRHGVKASIATPIHAEGQELPFGVLTAHSIDPRAFDADDALFMESLAKVIAAAIATARSEQARERLAAVVEHSVDAIVTYALDGTVTTWNRAAEKMFGYSAREMIGRTPQALLLAESMDEAAEIRRRLEAGEVVESFEAVRVRRDGGLVEVSSTLSPITGPDGGVIAAASILRDIGERKRLEEQLRQAQRLESVGRLAGGIAHDFNNLLLVVSGYTELLLERDDGSSREELREIAAAADRAARLTGQLLAFGRRQVLRPAVIDLGEVARGIVPMLERLLGDDVRVVSAFAGDLSPAKADRSQIEQILMNLAVNARDAMPNGGMLTIATDNVVLDDQYVAQHPDTQAGDHVMLAVTDTGHGMDAQTVSQIFEPFFTTKPPGVGTGLGLATVYGIVRQSDGSIWVYSEPGMGTSFKLYFPASAEAIDRTRVAAAGGGAPHGTETVLVVEDEPTVRQLTVEALRRCGYTVLAAANAVEALALLEEGRTDIDLLLSDLVMPGDGGRQLAETVRQQRPSIRVLFMSGYAADETSAGRTLARDDAFIEKPFSMEGLARKVRSVLDSGDAHER